MAIYDSLTTESGREGFSPMEIFSEATDVGKPSKREKIETFDRMLFRILRMNQILLDILKAVLKINKMQLETFKAFFKIKNTALSQERYD